MELSINSSQLITEDILDFINIGIFIIDEEYKIIKINTFMLDLLKEATCPMGKTCYEFVKKNNNVCNYCPVKATFSTRKEHKETIYNPFNEEGDKWYELHTHPIEVEGEIKYMMITYRDISKMKAAEKGLLKRNDEYMILNRQMKEFAKQLQESQLKYKALYENAPLAYQSLDQEACIIDVNPAWCLSLGYSITEVKGKCIGDFIHEEEQQYVEKIFKHLAQGDKINDARFRMKKKQGDYIYVSFEGVVAFSPLGEFMQTYCTFKDITDQYNYEQTLRIKNREYEVLNEQLLLANEKLEKAKNNAEESNHLKSEFLHNMSHEIRTPMNGIIGFADMIQDPTISAEKKDFFAKIIKSSSHQLLRIIDDILEISKLETKQVVAHNEIVNLNDLLLEQFSIFSLKAKDRQIPLYIKKGLSDREANISIDKTKLNKIIQNLLENALKFTSEGYIEFGYYVEGNSLRIYVKDTGVGISEDNIDLIFERFSQEEKSISRKQGGLGLGLSISKENAQILGGSISVKSEKGRGSIFTINLPYDKIQVPGAHSRLQEDSKEERLLTILIAEDEEINYLFLETVIKELAEGQIKILHAFNGKEAVALFKENEVDLVLMDVKMPVMDGHQATRIIKDINPNMPVVAQTAYATDYDRERSKDIGYDLYLTKPISQETLLELVQSHLDAFNQRQALVQTL